MGDYFRHWLEMEHRLEESGHTLPKIFCVNWFRKGPDGRFVWPGYGENMRVLQWIVQRVRGEGGGAEHLFGISPRYEDLNWTGLAFPRERFEAVIGIDHAAWAQEMKLHDALFEQLGSRVPAELTATKQRLEERLAA
jgi:phosphoenolpyruvate carboxykinase (GTP)